MFRNDGMRGAVMRLLRSTCATVLLLAYLGAYPATAEEGKTVRVLFLIGAGETRTVNRAVEELAEERIGIAADSPRILFEVITSEDVAAERVDSGVLTGADVVIADTMHSVLTRWLSANADFGKTRVYTTRTSAGEEKRIVSDPEISAYYSLPTARNLKNLTRWVLRREKLSVAEPEPPQTQPAKGYFHPLTERYYEEYGEFLAWYRERGLYKPDGGWIGVCDFGSNAKPGEPEPACAAVIERLERSGLNVLPSFFLSNANGPATLYLDENGAARVELICAYHFRFASMDAEQSCNVFARAKIPVLNLIRRSAGTLSDWRDSPEGLGFAEVGWQMNGPEVHGLIEPTLTGGKVETASTGGRRQFEPAPLPENIDRLAERVMAWRCLRTKPNAEKRVAIMYWNHSPGKQNVGAAYLNVFRSVEAILKRLAAEGYAIEGTLPTEDEIKELVLKYGRNIGSWAPGELDDLRAAGRTVEIPMTQYRAWYNTLDEGFRNAVETQWGRPDDCTVMCRDGTFILPAVPLGNVILIPQPSRGWSDDPVKTYHDPALWPHHQYIAFYLWLRQGFKADAIVSLGTHGTHEWLPGKQTGLSQSCAPEALIGHLPNVYPYIMDDIGEGLQAKRRGRGVVIDYLTPAFVKAGGYDDTRDLSALLSEYGQAEKVSPELAAQKLARIAVEVKQRGIDKELGLAAVDAEAVETVEHYLSAIAESAIPSGLHSFGVSPDETQMDDFVKLIRERTPELEPAETERKLSACGPNEMDSLVEALAGGFVEPGEGNDPIRNPDALPTGRNFYGFDPDRVPSKDAYALGVRMADEMVEKYRKEKGAFPEKIALIVWSIETQRNEGSQVATALHLMGMKPVWDRNGKVIGSAAVPGAELGRPRVDVHVQASGLFRDTFPGVIRLLDNAVREASRQKDVENFIARHNEKIRAALLQEGFSEADAEAYSQVRVFSEAPGNYSGRVQELVPNSGLWEKDDEIADVYIRQVSYGYGANVWGKPLQAAYTKNLEDVKIAMHTRSGNLIKAMDNDDVFGCLGGVAMAVRRVSGRDPQVVISRQENAGEGRIEDLQRYLGEEMRGRYLNPRWIEGMKTEGYAGAREMNKFMENFWGFQVTTPGSVNAAQWQQAFEVYVEDKNNLSLQEFFNKENPWAYQSMTARMLEAVRKNYWDVPEETRKTLAKEYALNVIENGVACCDHTCNNLALNQMVATLISLPGVLAPAQVAQFLAALEKATGKTLEEAGATRAGLRQKVEQARQEILDTKTQRNGMEQAEKKREGYEMEPQPKADEQQPFSSSGAPWIILGFAVFTLALFAIGWKRRAV